MEDKIPADESKKRTFWLNPDCLASAENGTNDNYISDKPPIKPEPSKGAHGFVKEHPTTYGETLMHLFKGNLGSGLFAMGDAIKNAGIIVGPSVVLVLGLLCTHCMHLLLTASRKIGERTGAEIAPDFARTVELCFENGSPTAQRMSKCMKNVVNVFLCMTQLGFCCVYFVFISSNIKQVADYYDLYLDVHIHMVLILLPIILSCLVRNLKYLAPLSAIANVLLGGGVVITFYFICQDLPSFGERKYVSTFEQFPLFFGTALFAFEGIGLVLPLKNEMKNPEQFQKPFGVLNVGMFIVTILYAVMGVFAYWQFGEGIQGSVTLNLPPGNILAQSVKIIIATAILLTYALQFYIAVEVLWPSAMKTFHVEKHPIIWELVFRTCLVLVTFVLAEAIPYLNLFISLVGAVSSTALALLIPPMLEFATGDVNWWTVSKNSLILLVGIVGCITGTYESINSIVNVFQNGEPEN